MGNLSKDFAIIRVCRMLWENKLLEIIADGQRRHLDAHRRRTGLCHFRRRAPECPLGQVLLCNVDPIPVVQGIVHWCCYF